MLFGRRVQIYGPLLAGKVPRLFHPAVCAPIIPGAWMPPFSLLSGTTTAAAAAVMSSEESFTRRTALCDDAMSAHLQAGRTSSLASSLHRNESMAETASRLLFCLVSWVSRIPSFSALAYCDQVDNFTEFSHCALECLSMQVILTMQLKQALQIQGGPKNKKWHNVFMPHFIKY